MRDNFDDCIDFSLSFEGGYVNHPKDPGGETNMGISKRSYPNEDIKGMTETRAKAIYRADYWNRVSADVLPMGMDLVALDAAINSGVSRGAKWLQKALGVSADGVIGEQSLTAALRAKDPTAVVKAACANRMGFLRGLKTWGTFGKGWSRRVAACEALGVSMAAKAAKTPVQDALAAGYEEAKASASKDRTNAGGSAVAGGGAAGGGISLDGLPEWAIPVAIAVVVIAVIFFIGRSRHNEDRAVAYEAQATVEGDA